MEITVLHNQSFIDIAIQYTGIAVNAFEIAAANNMAVSDQLIPGTALIFPSALNVDGDILKYYTDNSIHPATSINDLSIIPSGKGIGYMQIKKDFIVNNE